MLARFFGPALLCVALGAFCPAFAQPDRQPPDRQRGNEQRARGGQRGQEQGRGSQATPRRGGQEQQAQPRQGGHQGQGDVAGQPQREQRGDARGMQRAYPRSPRTEQQARAWQQQRSWAARGAWLGRNTWEAHRAQRWRMEHRTWTQRGGYGGYFVPADRFHVLFGSQHWFRLYTRPGIVDGYPRFWYGGYWWMIVDPWPEFWADNWYDADDVFIDYGDGYYLYNRRHPGVGLAVTIVF